MLGGANLNKSCSHVCITLVLTKKAHFRSIRIPFKKLAFRRELLQASTRYLPDNRPVERREGDLHYNFNRKSLPSTCSSWWTTVWSFSQIPDNCPVEVHRILVHCPVELIWWQSLAGPSGCPSIRYRTGTQRSKISLIWHIWTSEQFTISNDLLGVQIRRRHNAPQ